MSQMRRLPPDCKRQRQHCQFTWGLRLFFPLSWSTPGDRDECGGYTGWMNESTAFKTILNEHGQPVGFPVPGWTPRPVPARVTLPGRFCRVEPLDAARHAVELHQANGVDTTGRMWTYLSYGPFASLESYTTWAESASSRDDQIFYTIVEAASGKAVGVASYLRIDPANGSIEVGGLAFSPALQRTPAATEAMFLMMRYAFELGYRRYEWKCDALNAPSRAAAQRLGLSFEGIFRQAIVYKGRSRDTAWFAAIDNEWPALQAAFIQWLDPANFDDIGRQRSRLSDLTAPMTSIHPGCAHLSRAW
jgi:RimJ/RimL family protein N-acetyltransferase